MILRDLLTSYTTNRKLSIVSRFAIAAHGRNDSEDNMIAHCTLGFLSGSLCDHVSNCHCWKEPSKLTLPTFFALIHLIATLPVSVDGCSAFQALVNEFWTALL